MGISTWQQYWQDQADSLSVKRGRQRAVVNLGGDNKSIFHKCSADVVYVTNGGGESNE